MSGYVEAGYIAVLGSLSGYSLRLVLRHRSLSRSVRTIETHVSGGEHGTGGPADSPGRLGTGTTPIDSSGATVTGEAR
ncbi:MAG: hypothetical protein ACRD0I_08295 [Acidimicrobiales bacterium]